MGQRVTATGVNFRPGSPSTLGEKVASGLVPRFDTINSVNDNLTCFEDGFGDGGSFLDIGGHRFYVTVTKPFPEEVTDVSDLLSNTCSSCSESIDLGAMVEVLALWDEEGGDLPRNVCMPLECLLPQEHAAPLQSRTPWMSPSWNYAHHLTSPSTPSRPPRPWSGRASLSSARRPTSKTIDVA
jgi:hypothetical protein